MTDPLKLADEIEAADWIAFSDRESRIVAAALRYAEAQVAYEDHVGRGFPEPEVLAEAAAKAKAAYLAAKEGS